ncbi:hypothetical protein HY633_00125 [Candidatus Uhrbacteria bacterium]|nr:hypothetical protein [Candidatus Uhrbacteria bacterium]
MKSSWYESKEKAIAFRKRGHSLGAIQKRYGVPRSTLAGWLINVKLSAAQKRRLFENRMRALTKNRHKAAAWHRARKTASLREAEEAARKVLGNINTNDHDVLDIILAVLYLGEGFKNTVGTGLGNSDPLIVRTFLAVLRKNYRLETSHIRCELYLRADHDTEKVKHFWARELRLPMRNFRSVQVDARTRGSKTYAGYHGVCAIRCGNPTIQRKLLFLSRMCFEKIVREHAGS